MQIRFRGRAAIIAALIATLCGADALAGDPLSDAIKRVGYWHLHQTVTQSGGATNSHIDQDYDRCLDLRNPVPPKPVAGWICPEFNVQKTPTSYRMRGICTYPGDGHYSGVTELNLGRTPTYRLDTTTVQPDKQGRQVTTHLVRHGKLVGECPAGTQSIAPIAPPMAIMPHEHEH
jgi:hypothetical protein